MNEEAIWAYMNSLFLTFSNGKTSYNYGLFRSVLENMYQIDEDYRLQTTVLIETFSRLCWNLIILHGLRQSCEGRKLSIIETILVKVQGNAEPVAYDELPNEIQFMIRNEIKTVAKRYIANEFHPTMSFTLFENDLRREYIKINKMYYQFIQRHFLTLYRINNFEFLKYVERINHDNDNRSSSHLALKIDGASSKKDPAIFQGLLQAYRADLNECFYCERKTSSIHIVFFIPWEFIRNLYIWNSVLSCTVCKKKFLNKLPNRKFLDKILERNKYFQTIGTSERKEKMKKYGEQKMKDLYNHCMQSGGFFNIEWEQQQ